MGWILHCVQDDTPAYNFDTALGAVPGTDKGAVLKCYLLRSLIPRLMRAR